jgi:hypothetical protein
MPTIADYTAAVAAIGDPVSQPDAAGRVSLRLVAREDETKVALWSDDAMTSALADDASVSGELQARADRFQALAGAAMGPLGDQLDNTTRSRFRRGWSCVFTRRARSSSGWKARRRHVS